MKIPQNWTKEQTMAKLKRAHEQENEFNKEIGKIDKQIRVLIVKKDKLRRLISKNMKYCNKLVNMLF